mmetsp:Transcript_46807/g.94437  ORF Transcript_46807/g.94437 Transcript_46807/m.94437 type:complete len:99 (+) Transcript_46807:87-383(+)|eukprot:CAMPEP_0171616366 /NCGR_PEP_ID=MMETSP0990-20121206/13423_1 /TAXON_ID=483369 /ORGANISM="non described non described, Strain CCMP2098" /LENGTH=98 /DNA_ID=CAMNT_0012180595 /DNA_START=71 /DNA_END=367 /DNA_ORIENTATION=+
MNTKLTYSLGWGLLFGGTIGGAAYGIYLGKQGLADREIENLVLKENMHKELERIAAKRVIEGKSPLGIPKGVIRSKERAPSNTQSKSETTTRVSQDSG